MKEDISVFYTNDFYNNLYENNYNCAHIMMPYIIDKLQPKSVIDIGCGRGIFIKEIKDINPSIKIKGVDGFHVDKSTLLIEKDDFLAHDLTQDLIIDEKYDLALSLEVAEHLEEKYADIFMDSLTRTSDIIVFSAAIPMQGGTHHVNERWPSYWKSKFEQRGFFVSDCLKKYFWEMKDIEAYRRQNILLCIKNVKKNEILEKFKPNEDSSYIFDYVHPDFWLNRMDLRLKKINQLEKKCSETEFLLDLLEAVLNNNVDYVVKKVKLKGLWWAVDNIKFIEYLLKQLKITDLQLTQLENFSKINNEDEYIIYGAGKDGKAMMDLMKLFNKKIVCWCDQNKKGELIDNMMISSVEKMMEEYNGEVVIIASRKYMNEIKNNLSVNGKYLIYEE